jgi:serine/threonine protein kinase
MYPQFWLNYLK